MKTFYLMLFAAFIICALSWEKSYWEYKGNTELKQKSDSLTLIKQKNDECRRVFIKARTCCGCPILNLYDTTK